MFKKKQETKQEVDNGKNTQALIEALQDPDFKKAMIKASSDSDIDSIDLTKFLLLQEALHNRDNADYYTFWKDKNEIEQVNRLQTWGRLMPIVFGSSDKVKLCQEIVRQHVKDAMVNRSSLKRARESALVYAVKQDAGLVQTENQIKTFLRGK